MIAAKVPMRETGTATAGMRVARPLRRKNEDDDDDEDDGEGEGALDIADEARIVGCDSRTMGGVDALGEDGL